MTISFSAFVALVAGALLLIVRAVSGVPRASFAIELQHIALVTISTAIIGPLIWRVFRRIDAAFARSCG